MKFFLCSVSYVQYHFASSFLSRIPRWFSYIIIFSFFFSCFLLSLQISFTITFCFSYSHTPHRLLSYIFRFFLCFLEIFFLNLSSQVFDILCIIFKWAFLHADKFSDSFLWFLLILSSSLSCSFSLKSCVIPFVFCLLCYFLSSLYLPSSPETFLLFLRPCYVFS